MSAFAPQDEGAFDERGEVVDRPSVAGVAADYDAVDDGAVGGGSGVAAIGGSGGDVVGQAGSHGVDAADADFEGQNVHAAQNEALALIENRVAVFDFAGEVGVVGILAGDVRVDVVDRVRPGVAGEHGQLLAETMRQVDVQGVVVGVAIIHVALDHGVGRLRIGRC